MQVVETTLGTTNAVHFCNGGMVLADNDKGVNMYQDNKQPANWIHSQAIGDNEGKIYISDKGAVKITRFNSNGQEQFVTCLTPTSLNLLSLINITDLLNSPEYQAVLKAKEDNKAQTYMAKRMAQEQEKAAKKVQAALDQLKILGVDVSTLKVG